MQQFVDGWFEIFQKAQRCIICNVTDTFLKASPRRNEQSLDFNSIQYTQATLEISI